MSSYTVAVSGATGYAGGEFLRLLAAHDEFSVTTVCGHSSVGDTLGQHQPHLARFADLVVSESTAENLAGHDVVVLALPHGASGAIAAELETLSPDTLIVDLAADHRLQLAEAWERYYGSEHQGTWTYGLPELIAGGSQRQRSLIAGAKRIAVPGCNVTAVTLAVQPLVSAGLIDHTKLNAVLANGVSGAGKSLKPHLLASEILGDASPYSVGGKHRHIPEIEQNLATVLGEEPAYTSVRISFTPTLVPMSRGILATVTAPAVGALLTEADPESALQATLGDCYRDEAFVRVLPPGQWPHTAAVAGSNRADIQAAFDSRTDTVTVVAAIDNLVRGTAGQALQSIHLALGMPEAAYLPTEGAAP